MFREVDPTRSCDPHCHSERSEESKKVLGRPLTKRPTATSLVILRSLCHPWLTLLSQAFPCHPGPSPCHPESPR